MYKMNDYDKNAATELLSFLKAESECEAGKYYKKPASYYTDSVLAEGSELLGEVSSFGYKGDIVKANASLKKYLSVMGRSFSNFKDLEVVYANRKGDPHYYGQVVLRERRHEYALLSFLKGAGLSPEDVMSKYGLTLMACGPNSMKAVTAHIRPNAYFPFQVGKAYRIWNKPRDDTFYDFMKKENYAEADIAYLYNATINPSVLGVVCDGMRFEEADPAGLLFGAGGYFSRHAAKVVGYTSLSGSRWRNGTGNRGFICLYKVLSKNPLHLDGKCGLSGGKKYDKNNLFPYDMVWAHKGYLMSPSRRLKAGEQVVYDERQVTLMYVIEVTS